MTRFYVAALITPHGGNIGESIAFNHEKEMVFYQRENSVVTVVDPLFPDAYNVGDGSHFQGVVDEYIRAAMGYLGGIHLSTRQLLNPERRAKKPGTGRWTNAQHSAGVAAVSQYLGCSPSQIMYSATHDAAKGPGGHRTDDLVDRRGLENAHDKSRLDFLERSGFFDYLRSMNIIDKRGYVEELGVHISSIVDPPEGPSLINMPSETGDLEPERLQFSLFESNIWIRTDPRFAQEVLRSFEVRNDEQGNPRIVALTQDAARTLWNIYVRCHTEHWGEPLDSVMNELINVQNRFALTYSDGATKDLRQYSVAHSLFLPEEDLARRYMHMETTQGSLFMGALEKIIDALVRHQREVHLPYSDGEQTYSGPIAPDWMKIIYVSRGSQHDSQHTRYHDSDDSLVIQVMPGKQRYVNPFVQEKGMRTAKRLEDLDPGLSEERMLRRRWAAAPFLAHIDLQHTGLDLTPGEITAIREGLRIAQDRWGAVCQRKPMPKEVLTERIAKWGKRAYESSVSAARSAEIKLAPTLYRK